MRAVIILCVILTASAADWAGSWSGGGLDLVLTPVANNGWSGTARYEGVTSPLQATEQNGALVGYYRENGERFEFTARIDGATLVIDTPESDHYVLARVGAAPVAVAVPAPIAAVPPPATPVGKVPLTVEVLVGTWVGPQGTTVLRADGTGATGKDAFRWSLRDGGLHVENDQGFLQFPVEMRGDVLVLGSGPSVELQRAVGAAGAWYGWDGSVDPTIIISMSHHVVLLPDGTVGYAKGELDATRRQGWFSMRTANGARQTVGRWSQQGQQVQFTLGSTTYQAIYNEGRQTLMVRGMGQVNEGADVEFTRE